MDNNKLRTYLQQTLQPVFDTIIDSMMPMVTTLNESFEKANVPEEQVEQIIKGIIEQHSANLQASIKTGMPEDMQEKLKEALNGRR